MNQPTILIIEADVLVRNSLAEYLRECGYQVMEALDAAEARQLLTKGQTTIEIVLADVSASGENGFELAAWLRQNFPDIDVVLAGTVAKAVAKAGDLCEDGPAVSKPYDHQLVLNHIKRLIAARDRKTPKA